MAKEISSVKLNQASLSSLPPEVRVPAYDRGGLQPHIVHLGVGGFHRAHQAVYLDDLLALADTERWGETGIGVLPSDIRMRDALRGQDFLYTVVERSAAEQSARVIGSLTGYIYAPEDREGAIERMAAPSTRIVSLTITEGGYYIDESTGEFVAGHPDIQHDLHHLDQPSSSIGLVAEALDRRRLRGLPPFTLMSCDNLQENGHVARRVMLAYTGLSNSALQQWIAETVAFPNSMVDRITPATTSEDLAFVAERFGIEDAWPVMTEPFRQWVIEDHFSNGRPEWERVGAQLIGDVAPFETMKIRLLNGSHLAMAYLGALIGFTYVHEIMADPIFVSFVEAFMDQVTPIVPNIPGTSVADYKKTLLERFSNPNIRDQVTRICSEGSAKMPKWLLPSIIELLERDGNISLLVLVVASWIFYFGQGTNERGQPLEVVDARAAELIGLARSKPMDPRPMLAERTIFGERLPANPSFVKAVDGAISMLSVKGVHATMRHTLSSLNS
jgi:mannitol 2-dehydrogenase